MAISGIDNSSWDLLFQSQNASSSGVWNTDQSTSSDLNSRLMLLLERRLKNVDKQIQQGQANGQLSSEEVKKLQDMEQDIQDKLQALQQGQTDASTQDLTDLSQLMRQLNDELRKAMPEGHRHFAARSQSAPVSGQTTVGVDTTSQADGDGQSQSIDIYA